jgi:hypothetical protein
LFLFLLLSLLLPLPLHLLLLLHQKPSTDSDNDPEFLILKDSRPPSLPPSLSPPPPVRQRSNRAAWNVRRQKPSSRPFSSSDRKRSIRSIFPALLLLVCHPPLPPNHSKEGRGKGGGGMV